MPEVEKFGSWSLAAAAGTVFLALPLQPVLPYLALRAGDTAAWTTPVPAAMLALLLYIPVAVRMAGLPGGGDLIKLARTAAGEPGAILTGALVCGILVIDSGIVLRRLAESAVTLLYPHTPQTFAMVALALCALYGAYGGLADLVRLGRFLLPLFVLTICVILIGPLPWSDPRNLLPLWGSGPGALLGGSISIMGLYSQPILFLLLAAGHLRDRHRLWRAGLAATGGATILCIAIIGVILLVYPLPLGYSVTFPLQDMTRLVTGGRYYERIESVLIVFEFVAIAFYLAAMLHTAAAAYAGAFRMTSHRTAVLPLVTLAVIVSLFPADQGQVVILRAVLLPFSVAIGFVLPLVLVLLAAWRGRAQGGVR